MANADGQFGGLLPVAAYVEVFRRSGSLLDLDEML
jgi:hypothetical protein